MDASVCCFLGYTSCSAGPLKTRCVSAGVPVTKTEHLAYFAMLPHSRLGSLKRLDCLLLLTDASRYDRDSKVLISVITARTKGYLYRSETFFFFTRSRSTVLMTGRTVGTFVWFAHIDRMSRRKRDLNARLCATSFCLYHSTSSQAT